MRWGRRFVIHVVQMHISGFEKGSRTDLDSVGLAIELVLTDEADDR